MGRRVFASLGLLAACASALAQAPADGAALFAAHCQACHQPGAVGAPGIAPPLLGIVGSHTVDGVRSMFNMPSFADDLSYAKMAAGLRHVLGTYEKVADLA